MTYIVDTHILVWFLDKNNRLSQKYREIMLDSSHTFIFSAIVLAEIKYLIAAKRVNVSFESVIQHLGECDNCIIYPVDEDVVEHMPTELEIHDAIIVATGLVYKGALVGNVAILTEDERIRRSGLLPVA